MMRGPTSRLITSSTFSLANCKLFSQPPYRSCLICMRLVLGGFDHASEQRRLPFERMGESFNGAQCRRTDVMLHAFHVVIDDLLIDSKQFEKIAQKLMPMCDVSGECFAGGGKDESPVFLVLQQA